MCKAIRDIRADSRAEGLAEGKIAGKIENTIEIGKDLSWSIEEMLVKVCGLTKEDATKKY